MVCGDLLLVMIGASGACGDLWVLGFARFGLVFGFWGLVCYRFLGLVVVWFGGGLSFASVRVSMGLR